MSPRYILLIVCITFICVWLFVALVNTIPVRRTINRNIKFVRLFFDIVKLWRNKNFVRNIAELDLYDVDTLNKDDKQMELKYFAQSYLDRSLPGCLSDVTMLGLSHYNERWRHCITTRTRTVEKNV